MEGLTVHLHQRGAGDDLGVLFFVDKLHLALKHLHRLVHREDKRTQDRAGSRNVQDVGRHAIESEILHKRKVRIAVDILHEVCIKREFVGVIRQVFAVQIDHHSGAGRLHVRRDCRQYDFSFTVLHQQRSIASNHIFIKTKHQRKHSVHLERIVLRSLRIGNRERHRRAQIIQHSLSLKRRESILIKHICVRLGTAKRERQNHAVLYDLHRPLNRLRLFQNGHNARAARCSTHRSTEVEREIAVRRDQHRSRGRNRVLENHAEGSSSHCCEGIERDRHHAQIIAVAHNVIRNQNSVFRTRRETILLLCIINRKAVARHHMDLTLNRHLVTRFHQNRRVFCNHNLLIERKDHHRIQKHIRLTFQIERHHCRSRISRCCEAQRRGVVRDSILICETASRHFHGVLNEGEQRVHREQLDGRQFRGH